MAAYLIRRIWQMVPTLFGVVLLVFLLFKGFGGDPAEILGGLNATQAQVDAIRQQLGLNEPLWTQFGIFLKQIVTFDWGRSWATNESVAQPVRDAAAGDADGDGADPAPRHAARDPVRARRRLRARLAHRPRDHGRDDGRAVDLVPGLRASSASTCSRSSSACSRCRAGATASRPTCASYAPLPVMLAVAVSLAPTTRLYRTFFLDEIGHDYVRTARAKGLTENASCCSSTCCATR